MYKRQEERERPTVGEWAEEEVNGEAEARGIELRLREYARAQREHESSRALHAKLVRQLRQPEPPLPSPQRRAVEETLRRVGGHLAAYVEAQPQRQRAISKLASRIASLRAQSA